MGKAGRLVISIELCVKLWLGSLALFPRILAHEETGDPGKS